MEYFILKPDGEQTGTFSLDQIRSMLNSGYIGPDTQYWHEGMSDWQSVDHIEDSVNFPEPDPRVQHAPPPHKWTGSLARAIRSPQQQKRSPVVEPDTPKAPAAPAVPEPHRPAAEIPPSALRLETAPHTNGVHAPETVTRESARAAAPEPQRAPRRRFRLPRPSAAQLYAAGSILLAVAILAAVIASRHPAHSALSRVTILSRNACVLTDQTAIKTLEDDMHNSPVITRLKGIIATSTDGAFVQTASNGLKDEIVKHEVEVTQKYMQAGKVEIIEPGAYNAVAYFDDTGALVIAHEGAPWVAIRSNGAIVYAYLGNDFQLRAQ
jgi:hypothetical protein